jgi:hypothetical protein
LLSSDAVNVERGADVSIGQWGELPSAARWRVEPQGHFWFPLAEEQRVKVRVSFLDPRKPTSEIDIGWKAITTWSAEKPIPTAALRRDNEWMTFVVKRGKAH